MWDFLDELNVDQELKDLIPPLSSDEYSRLEQSIIEEGCREPIVVWHNTIIDGHNRYKICKENNIPFKTVERDFATKDDVKLWMIGNQLARRNINSYARTTLVSLSDEIQAKRDKAKEKQSEAGGDKKSEAKKVEIDISDFENPEEIAFSNFGKSDPKPINTTVEIADRAGVGKSTASKTIQINKAINEAVKQNTTVAGQKPEELKEKLMSGEVSIDKAYKQVKDEQRKQKQETAIQEQIDRPKTTNHIDIYATDKKYRVIYADPPWSYNDKQNTELLGGAEKHYPTMPLKEICNLPIPTENDAVLFLWVTSPLLEDCFEVIKAWGFKYKSSFVWDKVKHNMGHYNSVRHEFLLICTKGSCVPDVPKLYDSVQSIERSDHSRKPKEFRDIIDTLYPAGDRLELFAREAPEGWDVWGNMA